MHFQLIPVLDKMAELYQQPQGIQRFQNYLRLLQKEGQDNLELPIMGFNPMGKLHVLTQLQALRALEAEQIAREVIEAFNQHLDKSQGPIFEVVLNLADDLKGLWTKRAATEFSAYFQLTPLLKRRFCTPFFWTSETYGSAEVARIVEAALLRTVHQEQYGAPNTLQEHVAQEVFVFQQGATRPAPPPILAETAAFYRQHQSSDHYPLLFNFFYGDDASAQLGYAQYGHAPQTGFHYAHHLAQAPAPPTS